MGDLEKYIHTDAPDRLVQLAVIHAEFEALHPFLDGNGRLGRMIIPLFLVEKKLLSSPNFFVSAFFDQDRQAVHPPFCRSKNSFPVPKVLRIIHDPQKGLM